MKMFEKTVSVDRDFFSENSLERMKKLTCSLKLYNSKPSSEKEVIKRIGNADCVLVTWQTPITKNVIESCGKIRYIGVIGKTPNIDMKKARENGIAVSNIAHYGHEAVPEFIFACLLYLARGVGRHRWKSQPCELGGKTIGIVGMGCCGQEMALHALRFCMNVKYYSKTRKPDMEKKGAKYVPLKKLLSECDIISMHTPAKTLVLKKHHLDSLKEGTILVDTCLGGSIDQNYFLELTKRKRIIGVFDLVTGNQFYLKSRHNENVLFPNVIAGRTIESADLIGNKIVENMKTFLKNDK